MFASKGRAVKRRDARPKLSATTVKNLMHQHDVWHYTDNALALIEGDLPLTSLE